MLHPVHSTAVDRALTEPALGQVRQKECLGSSSEGVLNISHCWLCGEAKINVVQWPEGQRCTDRLVHIKSFWNEYKNVTAPYLSMSVVSRALIPSAKGLSGSADICSYW